MPFRDGTGPEGKGPLTGRGSGKCLLGRREVGGGRIKFRKRDSLGLAIAGIFAQDIARPDGLSRKFIIGITQRITGFVKANKLKNAKHGRDSKLLSEFKFLASQ